MYVNATTFKSHCHFSKPVNNLSREKEKSKKKKSKWNKKVFKNHLSEKSHIASLLCIFGSTDTDVSS